MADDHQSKNLLLLDNTGTSNFATVVGCHGIIQVPSCLSMHCIALYRMNGDLLLGTMRGRGGRLSKYVTQPGRFSWELVG